MTVSREVRMYLEDNGEAVRLFGHHDENLRLIERISGSKVVARGAELMISGEPAVVEQTAHLFEQLIAMLRAGQPVGQAEIEYAAQRIRDGQRTLIAEALGDYVLTTVRGKQIRAKTLGQHTYLQAIQQHSIVFGIGPAGTGKTYLAVVMAVAALKKKEINRIILTRPAVEAGERLGFLPGDLQDKVDPYLRPLYDGLFDTIGMEAAQKYIERGVIEIAPLAYMRGRTLDDSFIILDEAQNTTPEQMKMFLTRIGFGSKVVVTGDITQVDLPRGAHSGLVTIQSILREIDGIFFHIFTAADVVRNPLVGRIIRAYEEHEKALERGK
ncbi:phosphate starvation-inducible PhoH-like protein [Heliophilum fasciatum]|uniref:PhoH-like protein n=2 Tax=Heliophilum fasciatum TaxID=35700 RepID=A0A4R2RK29_9FIRM|nr:phosphate starvation-inducible PhoH-like protein [Heliophilum fasciatum]TCP64210.1 phosphate starvation-inducible PhoH-like protein [Heliophilum fasciatum]